MQKQLNKSTDKYQWTQHSQFKMNQYRLSESLVKRVIRYPTRTEEGIVPNTVAVMRPTKSKKYSEIWAMYQLVGSKKKGNKNGNTRNAEKIRIITAWRYPGESPKRDPIPREIIEEVRSILFL